MDNRRTCWVLALFVHCLASCGTRRMIRSLSLQRARSLAAEALVAATAADVAAILCSAFDADASGEGREHARDRVERR